MKKVLFGFLVMFGIVSAVESIESPAVTTMITTWGAKNMLDTFNNYMATVDQVYNQVDMIRNQWKQLENGYEQIQNQLKEAASWKFDEIQWDGDFDFRNEIASATASVNKQLDNIRKAEETFTSKKFNSNGVSYSMADLFDLRKGGAFSVMSEVAEKGFDKVARAYEGKLTEAEKQTIWQRYGLSPKNYVYMKKKAELCDDMVMRLAGASDEDVQRAKREYEKEKQNKIIQKIIEDDENSEKSIFQKMSLLFGMMHDGITDMSAKMSEALAYRLQKDMKDKQDEEDKQLDQQKLFQNERKPDDLL